MIFLSKCGPNSVSLKMIHLWKLSDSSFQLVRNLQWDIIPVSIQPSPCWNLAVRNTERIIPVIACYLNMVPCTTTLSISTPTLNILPWVCTYPKYTTLSLYLPRALGIWKIVEVFNSVPFPLMVFNEMGDISQICKEMAHADLVDLAIFVCMV